MLTNSFRCHTCKKDARKSFPCHTSEKAGGWAMIIVNDNHLILDGCRRAEDYKRPKVLTRVAKIR